MLPLLSACGNVSQTIQARDDWQEVAISDTATFPRAGKPEDWAYETERLAEGAGRLVKRGDLVRIRMNILAGHHTVLGTDSHEMWLLAGATGYEEAGDQLTFRFSLGSRGMREALPGRRVGDRFAARNPIRRLDWANSSLPELIPAKALLFVADDSAWPSNYASPKRKPLADQNHEGPLSFIQLAPSNDPARRIALQIEVIDSCPARLLKREGEMQQKGYMSGSLWHGDGVRAASTSRSGKLQWAAVEARCGDGTQAMRIEAGPTIFDTSLREAANSYPLAIPATDAVYVGRASAGLRLKPQ